MGKVAKLVLKTLGKRPGLSVDGGKSFTGADTREFRNHLDDEDFIVGRGAWWIDDESSGEFGVDAMAQLQVLLFGSTPIEKESGRSGFEVDLLGRSWSDGNAFVGREGGIGKSVHGDGNIEGVVQRRVNFRSLRNSDDGSGILKWLAGLTECIDGEGHAVIGFGMPGSFDNLG